MIDLAAFFRAYEQSAPTSSIIAPSEFVSDTVFACKSGAQGSILSTKGQEYETRTSEELAEIAKRFNTAIRPFDERWTIYQWFIKRDGAKVVGTSERARFLERDGLHSIETAMGCLQHKVSPTEQVASFTRHADLLGGSVLDRHDAFAFLRRLLNPTDWYAEAIRYREPIDRFICTTAIQDIDPSSSFLASAVYWLLSLFGYSGRQLEFLEWGNYKCRVFSLMQEPELEDESLPADQRVDALGVTVAHMLADLQRISGNFILCTEWRASRKSKMRQGMKFKRRFRFGQRKSVSLDKQDKERLADPEANIDVDHLGKSISALRHGNFGDFSLVAVVFDQDPAKLERTCSELVRVFADNDAVLMEEKPNRLAAFLSIIPGNSAFNFRQRWITSSNYADLSFLWKAGGGEAASQHLKGAPYLSVFETPDGTPYYFNRHVADVGHVLITGAIGSGKTYLANRLIEDEQQYGGYTWILDLTGKYEDLTRRCGGRYYRFSFGHQDARFNPFAAPNTEQNRHFQLRFVRLLLVQEGCTPSSEDEREIAQAIRGLYVLEPCLRRLGVLATTLPARLHSKLHRWIGKGEYAQFFDHADATIKSVDFQCFDVSGLADKPELLAPFAFCLFHEVDSVVKNSPHRFKGLHSDEGWKFLLVKEIRALVHEALKTWRNYNAWVTFITQSAADLKAGDLLEVVNETCPTKIFMPNPGADADVYGETFKFNDRERELLNEIRTSEFLVKRPDGSMVLKYRAPEAAVLEYEAQGAVA